MRSSLKATWLRCAIGAVTMVAGTAVAVGVTGAPAYAATPRCNGVDWINNIHASGYFEVPVYRFSGGFTVVCLMSQGDRGDDVLQLQWNLNYCYSERLSLDGDFGSLTKAALVRAQRREHIYDDGIYGAESAMEMTHPQIPGGGCGHL